MHSCRADGNEILGLKYDTQISARTKAQTIFKNNFLSITPVNGGELFKKLNMLHVYIVYTEVT